MNSSLIGISLSMLTLAAGAAKADDEDLGAVHDRDDKIGNKWFYLTGEAGVDVVGLNTFEENLDTLTANLISERAIGPSFAVSTGFRLVFLTLGVRAQAGYLDGLRGPPGTATSFWLWRVGPELGVRIPLNHFEPNFSIGAGYATIGGTDEVIQGLGRGLDIDGVDLAATIGLDYFVTQHLTIGGKVRGEALLMSRPGIPLRDIPRIENVASIDDAKAEALQADGSSAGGALTFTLNVGLHL